LDALAEIEALSSLVLNEQLTTRDRIKQIVVKLLMSC